MRNWKLGNLVPLFALSALAVTVLATGSASAAPSGGAVAGTVGGRPLDVTSGTSNVPTISATLPAGTAVKPAGASPMAASWSFRWYFGVFNGCKRLDLYNAPVSPGQAVMVSATESDGAGNEIIGAATYTVHNVAVRGDGVILTFVCVDWNYPLNVWLHYLA
jgi:hypothetical protein